MSDALAMSLPQPAPSTGRNWIKANIMAALISAVATLAAAVLGHTLGAVQADTGAAVRIIIFLANFLAVGAGTAAYAVLAGRVLREKLPAFPIRTWVVLHVTAGLLCGLSVGYNALQPPADMNMKEMTETLASSPLLGVVIIAAVVGAIGGLVVGSFQALIMRKAARGLAAWIGFSAIAVALALMAVVLLTIAGLPLIGMLTGMTGDLVGEATAFVVAIIMAFAMLPAVLRLAPR